MKIGFFDSGLGGLTILKAVAKDLPEYDYYYYGDTANLPYGDKTEEEIYKFATDALDYLFREGCLLVIIACNSASADTARKIQQEYLPLRYKDRKVLGVIVPTVEEIIEKSFTTALLIATSRTVESEKYKTELNKLSHEINLTQIATPDLVNKIESGKIHEAVSQATNIINTEGRGSRAVVLGCTHYSLIKNELRERFPEKVILSQDEIIPHKLKKYLIKHPEIESRLSKGSDRKVHLTEHRPDYDKTLQFLLGGVIVEEE